MKLRDAAETFPHAAGAGAWVALRARRRATKRAVPPSPRAGGQRRLIASAFAGGAALLALWAALALLARVRRMPILRAYPLYGYALLHYLPVVTRTDRTRSRQPMALEVVPPPASPVIQRRAVESEAAQAAEPALAVAR
ncbi:MAG TPA: hypothetical protein VLJ14_04395 [Ktedonobacterales bacterium]|nr:hypothetical protein [Ktedonobacterales bacterium]